MTWWSWQQADGQLHAYRRAEVTPTPGRAFTALCEAEVTPTEEDFHLGGWPQPTCWVCHRQVLILDDAPLNQIPELTDDHPPMLRRPDGTACTARPPRPRDRR